jgi:hypothetical protein
MITRNEKKQISAKDYQHFLKKEAWLSSVELIDVTCLLRLTVMDCFKEYIWDFRAKVVSTYFSKSLRALMNGHAFSPE